MKRGAHESRDVTKTAPTQIHENYLIVRADRKYYKIDFDDLIYIEGQKAYVTFNTKQQQITALVSLKELEEKLPPDQFIRIHKSFIVSINKIQSLESSSIEIARKHLPIGNNYRKHIDDVFRL
jgi:DNA-binding LytR/AlgR family response regulator